MASRKRLSEALGSYNKRPKTDCKSTSTATENETGHCDTADSPRFLCEINAYILPAGIEKARLGIFKTQIQKNGGKVHDQYDGLNSTHIIVDDKMEIPRLLRIMNLDEAPKVPIVKSAWLSQCLRSKNIVPFDEYRLKDDFISSPGDEIDKPPNSDIKPKQTKLKVESYAISNKNFALEAGSLWHGKSKGTGSDSSSEYEPSDDDSKTTESTSADSTSNVSPHKQVPVEKWICAQSSKNPKPNFNKHITDKLEEMVKAYESTNDKWRAFGYQKAIQALRRHPKEISTWEEAKALQGVGGRLADKIWEIAESGELRKLKEFESCEEVRVLKLFTNVWGAGPHTAQLWYQQGFRTISDLQQKAKLNHQQQVGVRLYDDLLDRMPKEEAGEIEAVVKQAAESIQEGIIARACGSYRRGKATCGDVDVLVTHPDGKSHKGIFHKLLAKLKESGFLTDDLVSAEETGNQKKYLGVCKLPGDNRKHRRLDIIVVPYDEYGCALVYFTGSAHFNRSLRHLCKKQNMSLNEHALKTGVVRKGAEKIYEGTVIPTPTEESVFQALKVPYRPPEERDH